MKGGGGKCVMMEDPRVVIPSLEKYITEDWRDKKQWTDLEVEQLKRYYGKVPTKSLVEHFGRSLASIQCKANLLGLKYNSSPQQDE